MAATKYTYSITNDFPGTGFNSSRLVADIAASSIVIALDRIDTSGDVCDIWFKDSLSAADKTTLDGDTTSPAGGLIAVHSGEPLVSLDYETTADGHLVIANSYGHFDEDAKWKGFFVEASGIDTDTIHDHKITNQIYIKGGKYWSYNAQSGDYAEASIVDKDDALGLFDTYGLVSGVDILEVFKFAETIYLDPNGGQDILDTPDAALVYINLYLRVKVHTTTSENVDVGCSFQWFEE